MKRLAEQVASLRKLVEQFKSNEISLRARIKQLESGNSNNPFEVLTVDDDDDEDDDSVAASTSRRTSTKPTPESEPNTSRSSERAAPSVLQQQAKSSSGRQGAAKSARLPPINIYGKTAKNITELLAELSVTVFDVKKSGDKKHVLSVKSLADFDKVRERLNCDNAEHFTYTPAQNKNKTFILRGLDGNEECADVLLQLQQLKIDNVEFVKCVKLKNGQRPNSLFVVQATAASVEANIVKTTKLEHVIVRWERLKRQDILQCHRCQRLGHTASNCGMRFRCVKCNEQHEPGQCKLPRATRHPADQVFCVACNAFGHPASYRGCPQIVQFQQSVRRRREEANRATEERRNLYANYTRPNVSFRDAAAPRTTTNNMPSTSRSATSAPTAPTPTSTQREQTVVDPQLKALLVSIVNDALTTVMKPIQDAMREQSNRIDIIYHALES